MCACAYWQGEGVPALTAAKLGFALQSAAKNPREQAPCLLACKKARAGAPAAIGCSALGPEPPMAAGTASEL